jgi:hypothetical protein
MGNQPFYHLRPNKYIDRQLFVQILVNLSPILNIQDYQYIGFGSFLFDDFKLVHNQLGISEMTSLEDDVIIYERANFNRPYSCIKIVNQNSSDYISGLAVDKPTIIWLDYTSARKLGTQFSDFCSTLNILNSNDIVKITLNAHVKNLDREKQKNTFTNIHCKRLNILRNRIKSYIPAEVTERDLTEENYPALLFRCLKKAAGIVYRSSQNKIFSPLLLTVYQDGQKMITLTGIILDKNKDDNNKKIKDSLSKLPFISLDWNRHGEINVPKLTAKEIIHINSLLPSNNIHGNIRSNHEYFFSNEENKKAIDSYLEFYKYYPNFHHVSF